MEAYLIKFLASVLIWILFLGLIILWVIDGRVKKEQALHGLLAAGVAWVLANMIKELFPTPRPFLLNELPTFTLTKVSYASSAFPSAHTAVSFAIAFTIWLHDKRLGSVFVLAAFLVGVGRIMGNVHFPADILGGAFLGILCAFIIEKLHLFKLTPKK